MRGIPPVAPVVHVGRGKRVGLWRAWGFAERAGAGAGDGGGGGCGGGGGGGGKSGKGGEGGAAGCE